MCRLLFLLLLIAIFPPFLYAQKKEIKRSVVQKNYEGFTLIKEQKYEAALLIFNEALTDDPKAFFVYQNRAFCNLKLGDTISAINDYKTNLKYEPNNTESLYSLGNIYKKQKDTIQCKAYFTQAIKNHNAEFSKKKLASMSNFIGHYLQLHEQYESALNHYRTVKKERPTKPSVCINSAVCYFALDSIQQFCEELEQAFILGGAVNCYILKVHCNGCNHLVPLVGEVDTISKALDLRLIGMIPDTIFVPFDQNFNSPTLPNKDQRK